MSETISASNRDFSSVINALSLLVEPQMTEEWFDEGWGIEYPSFTGKFRGLKLEPAVAEIANVGERASCDVVGDAYIGVAIILRPRNPFDKQRYGFFIQPEFEGPGYQIWHGPARKRDKNDWIGASLLDETTASLATPDISDEFIGSLAARARR